MLKLYDSDVRIEKCHKGTTVGYEITEEEFRKLLIGTLHAASKYFGGDKDNLLRPAIQKEFRGVIAMIESSDPEDVSWLGTFQTVAQFIE